MGNGAVRQIGNGVKRVDYGNGVVGILHIAGLSIVLTKCLVLYKSRCQLIVIPGVVRILYQDYAYIP
jgi:hypothetical protein